MYPVQLYNALNYFNYLRLQRREIYFFVNK